jgi:uncharacterized membrane protein YgdD (TMEM256/DUF423 family)
VSFRVELMQETVRWAETLNDGDSQATVRLDDKSQQTGTVAGVFLAAALGFLKPESFNALGSHAKVATLWLLLLGIVCLVGSVVACLSVVWLRANPMPIALSVMLGITEDIVAHPEADLDDDVKISLYRDRLKIWQQVLSDRSVLNQRKAKWLKGAQSLLAAGILLISCLLFVVIWTILPHVHHT